MELERKQFTMYASIFQAIDRIKNAEEQAAAYRAVCLYSLNGTEPEYDTLPESAEVVFIAVKPVLDNSRARACSGRAGGSKPKANASKP